MAKVYVQEPKTVWSRTASLASSGSASGSRLCEGYTRWVGILITSNSLMASGSGLRIWHSTDQGSNWDGVEDYTVSTCSGSLFSGSLYGNAVKFYAKVAAGNACAFRAAFRIYPI